METLKSPTGMQIRVFEDVDALATAFAEGLTTFINRRLEQVPEFSLMLTGGRSVGPLYARLTDPQWAGSVDWTRVKVFWGDERTVPPDSEDSNYRLAWESWLQHGAVPESNIFRMRGEADPPEAAKEYAQILGEQLSSGPGNFPELDLILLGMGDDGHVASLFPGTRALDEDKVAVVANLVPQLDTMRLTVTFPVLNAAREVWMLVTGEGKADRVIEATGYIPGGEALPVWRVRPMGNAVRWWLDQAAGSRLPRDL